MQRERDRLIAEALAAPPPPPEQCVVRTLHLAGHEIKLRVPSENRIRHEHIRQAHEVASRRPEGEDYHAALQAEFSRLQDEQPWYWDQLWPGGLALARRLLDEPSLVYGKTVLEFGTGIGLLALSAAIAGAALVVATDIEPVALTFVEQSVLDNALGAQTVATAAWDWHDPPPEAEVASRAPFDVVLLPDVLYDKSAVVRLGMLAPQLVKPGGLICFADGTDRPYGEEHSNELLATICATPGFRRWSCTSVRDGASAEDGGAAPDRPVRIVIIGGGHTGEVGSQRANVMDEVQLEERAAKLLAKVVSREDGKTSWLFADGAEAELLGG